MKFTTVFLADDTAAFLGAVLLQFGLGDFFCYRCYRWWCAAGSRAGGIVIATDPVIFTSVRADVAAFYILMAQILAAFEFAAESSLDVVGSDGFVARVAATYLGLWPWVYLHISNHD